MSFQIDWIETNHILLVEITGDPDIKEAYQINNVIQNYVAAATQPVHLLVDLSEFKTTTIEALPVKASINYLTHPNMGTIVIVGKSVPVTLFLFVIKHALHVNFIQADTRQEALLKLHNQNE